MPNAIDQNGLTIQTIDEIISEILNGTTDFPGMFSIYGNEINVDPNSPDGQMVNIVAQAKRDVLELIAQEYNSFDPDKAIGVSLNARVAINGIRRNPGTQTQQTVLVTTDRALTLPGLDTSATPFTVADTSGNQFQLSTTATFSGAGALSLPFQAVLLGPINPLPNTVTTVVTITLGVTAVNNATGPSSVGLTEETDYALRVRRQKSVALPSKGFLDGLLAALVDTDGVTEAKVYENNTGSTDGNGIPGHSIWAIVEGGEIADIANAIYVKRNAGCGMKGSVTYPYVQSDGSVITISFDRPASEALWISFNVVALGTGSVDPVFIRNQLLLLLSYGIGQQADTTSIVQLIRSISPAASVSAEGVSDDGATYVSLLNTATIDKKWSLLAAHIIINGTPG